MLKIWTHTFDGLLISTKTCQDDIDPDLVFGSLAIRIHLYCCTWFWLGLRCLRTMVLGCSRQPTAAEFHLELSGTSSMPSTSHQLLEHRGQERSTLEAWCRFFSSRFEQNVCQNTKDHGNPHCPPPQVTPPPSPDTGGGVHGVV